MLLSEAFHTHGHFCASHPWEVIVGTLTLTISMLSMGGILGEPEDGYQWKEGCNVNEDVRGLDTIVMTVMRCLALLYIYHQFRKLWNLGSKYVLGIAGLFAVYSSLVFSSSVINILKIDFAELNEAWPFFLLLIDLSKASLLAQFALRSSCQKEVRENIARGMAALGPTITLDTLVETLVIGVGTLSGVKRLEMICCFACMSVVVNYIVFMSFYPACLSLVLELSRENDQGRPVWQLTSLTRALQDEEPKPNPVIQRVKVIMSAGLVLVHAHSRWPIILNRSPMVTNDSSLPSPLQEPMTGSLEWASYLNKWVSGSTDQVVMLILAIALSLKYIFFENKDGLPESLVPFIANQSNEDGERPNSKCILVSREPHPRSTSVSCGSGNGSQLEEVILASKAVQTENALPAAVELAGQKATPPPQAEKTQESSSPPREIADCLTILKQTPSLLTDDEVMALVNARHILPYRLEWALKDPERGVKIRRKLISKKSKCGTALENLPFGNYDYSFVMGACCENVVGYVPVPVGIVGPLLLDGKLYHVPMATTEGCLVASTNRGCRALSSCDGVRSSVVADGMTRGPVVKFPTAQQAGEAMLWLNNEENFKKIKSSFDSTSRFARLTKILVRVAARYLFIRFQAKTGDAMGMNMLSKGSEIALHYLQTVFPDMEIISLSGNFCTDKKPAAVNWIEGRGKSVVCEAIVPGQIVREVLKTTVHDLIDKNTSKNLVGSAIAGSIGGFNAQAANIVTAIYIATGQDPAQNVSSSNCLTLMESSGPDGSDLYISVTMPSIEIGTVGGGTILPPQGACLELLGVKGACTHNPGQNATTLARIVCGAVMAGELSLMSALAAGHLVKSHLTHNRSQVNLLASTPK